MGSQRTTEELFEMSVSVTATLLIISVRGLVGGSERLRQSQPKKKRLVETEESAASVLVEGEVQFVGAVSSKG